MGENTLDLRSDSLRKHQMAVTDEAKIEQLLRDARVGCLGLVDGDEPYVIPMNFVWHDQSIYVHGAADGRKADLMRGTTKATFIVLEDRGTIAHPVPAKTDTAYKSVMVFGRVSVVADLTEATAAMQAMLLKYVPGYYEKPLHSGHVESYVSSAGSHTAVYRLQVERLTAKENPVSDTMMFFSGRTQAGDLRAKRTKHDSTFGAVTDE
jgi:uncharacterized protein